METLDKHLDMFRNSMDPDDFESIRIDETEKHYHGIEKQKVISREVFESLDEGKQFHFLKHYGENNIR